MAFKKISGGNFRYVKYKDCEEGDILAEGTYLGHRQGTYGIQHQIREEGGDIVVLNSSGHLNWLLENMVSQGDYIRVTYDGTIKLTKGPMRGKESHQFVLEVDEERKVGNAEPIVTSSRNDEALEEDSEEVDEEEVVYSRTNSKRDLKRKEAPAKVEEDEEEEEAPPARKKAAGDDLLARYRR